MVLDIVCLVSALFGFYLGFNRGIILTVFSVISYVFGAMVAFKFAKPMTGFLEQIFNDNNPLWYIAGLIISFIGTMFLIRLFARGLEGILKTGGINIVNKVLGGALLAGFMILMYSILLWFGDSARMIDKATKKQSVTYEYLEQYPTQVWAVASKAEPILRQFWDQSLDVLDRMEDMSERTETEQVYDIEDEK